VSWSGLQSSITGVAGLFLSRAASFEIGDDKVTISAKQKYFVLLMLLMTAFDQISGSKRSICCFFS